MEYVGAALPLGLREILDGFDGAGTEAGRDRRRGEWHRRESRDSDEEESIANLIEA